MSKDIFKMKQFTLNQKGVGMKVGTDGVLLGAWAKLDNLHGNILDIGAGTGLVSLMLAQRYPACFIEALEIEPTAFEVCVENFENCLWNNRLFCYHAALQEFAEDPTDQYDLIVCNPPFYAGKIPNDYTPRDLARKQAALPLPHLLKAVADLLNPNGNFCVILPKDQQDTLLKLGEHFGLFVHQICEVRGNATSDISRILVKMRKDPCNDLIEESLVIETQRNQWTDEYKQLTGEFYLKT